MGHSDSGMQTLLAAAANPRRHHVHIACECGERVDVGIADEMPSLRVQCLACGEELSAAEILLANLHLARVETAELGRAIGSILASFAAAWRDQPHTRSQPREALEHAADLAAGDCDHPAVAALAAAIMRR